MKALFSVMTAFNYDATLFDSLMLPAGIVKDDVVNNLVMELAELELIYASTVMMKTAIGMWSKKELPVWTKLAATTTFDYKPLENLYRTEEYTDKETRNLTGSNNETRNLTGSNNETRNLSVVSVHDGDTTENTANSGTDIQKEYVSGFNEATATLAKQADQTKGTGVDVTGTQDATDTVTDTGTDNRSMTDSGTVDRAITDTGTVDTIRTANMHGSIGVITPQQMIEQERRVSEFNIVDYIIDSFKKRFCILIY